MRSPSMKALSSEGMSPSETTKIEARNGSRINKKATLTQSLVFVRTCGSLPHAVHFQTDFWPKGRIGIQKMWPQSDDCSCCQRVSFSHVLHDPRALPTTLSPNRCFP